MGQSKRDCECRPLHRCLFHKFTDIVNTILARGPGQARVTPHVNPDIHQFDVNTPRLAPVWVVRRAAGPRVMFKAGVTNGADHTILEEDPEFPLLERLWALASGEWDDEWATEAQAAIEAAVGEITAPALALPPASGAPAATEKQVSYAADLLDKSLAHMGVRLADGSPVIEALCASSRRALSDLIDRMKAL